VIRWALARVLAVAIPLRFDPDQAAGIDATLELRVGIRGRLAVLTIAVADCRCVVRPGPSPQAAAAATVGLSNLIRMVIGDVGWPQLLSRGSLQFSGDPFLALRVPALFRLPAGQREPARERLSERRRALAWRAAHGRPDRSASPR
jgi:hypothetical protein